ncbi:MAG: 50S ribosomal protein L5 [Candidatus Levybacteria bacterium]|nr:50S ribosomal protein L5 [Candidatus Levybacteria bacterium]
MTNLQKKFKEEILSRLSKELGIANRQAIPSLSKIVINVGVRNVLADKKNLEVALGALEQITGQKPKVTAARKSIATFKLREGDKIGLMVTLRGNRMYDFYEKLVNVVLPRLRDFHGVKKESFDNMGNYTLGFTDSSVFPEIDVGKIDTALIGQGLEITIVTTAKNKDEGYALLQALGMPFQKGVKN